MFKALKVCHKAYRGFQSPFEHPGSTVQPVLACATMPPSSSSKPSGVEIFEKRKSLARVAVSTGYQSQELGWLPFVPPLRG